MPAPKIGSSEEYMALQKDAAKVKILAVRGGTDFLIDAGRGDPDGSGQDFDLARVYDLAVGTMSDPWITASIVSRGYWENTDTVSDSLLAAVRTNVAALAAT